VAGHRVFVGKPAFLRDSGVAGVTALETLAAPHEARGATAILIALDDPRPEFLPWPTR